MRDISIRFGAVQALDGVQLTVRSGEIHTLMGENGAGKSTLLKVLTGVYKPDAGEIRLDGEAIHPKSAADAQRLGVSMVYQEVNLIPYLSVAENICLGRKRGVRGLVSYGAMRRRAEKALDRLGLKIDTDKPVASYSIAVQQMVAIARALDVDAKVLVLDEPTSSLDPGEVQRLYEVMRRLRNAGLGLVFVTHFLDQVFEVSDRITVLRNGKYIGEWDAAELTRETLVGHMLGREIKKVEAVERETETARAAADAVENSESTTLLEARQVGRSGSVDNLHFALRSGQTTGFAGLLGSGRTEAGRLIFGADKTTRGQWMFEGRPTKINSPRKAMSLGIGFCSEDRKTEGIIPDLTVRENIILALQTRRGWWKPLGRAKQRLLADEYIKALRIATPDSEKAVRFLSGGNQQKVILARWLAANPRLLVVDEPTRGIDVGAKAEIEALINRLRNDGMAVVFISSELDETLRVSEQLVVMRDRKHAETLRGEDINEARVMKAMAGGV
jgi:simple sugar transport system ATP-binding protein